MQEGVRDIQLLGRPTFACNQCQNCPDGDWLYHWRESLAEIYAGTLRESTHYPASFVSLQGPVRMKFVLEDPFPRHHMNAAGSRNKAPDRVSAQGVVLEQHRSAPVGVAKSLTNGRRHRRYCAGGGRTHVTRVRFDDPGAAPCDHLMAISPGHQNRRRCWRRWWR
jgi:hypothetical protein